MFQPGGCSLRVLERAGRRILVRYTSSTTPTAQAPARAMLAFAARPSSTRRAPVFRLMWVGLRHSDIGVWDFRIDGSALSRIVVIANKREIHSSLFVDERKGRNSRCLGRFLGPAESSFSSVSPLKENNGNLTSVDAQKETGHPKEFVHD